MSGASRKMLYCGVAHLLHLDYALREVLKDCEVGERSSLPTLLPDIHSAPAPELRTW